VFFLNEERTEEVRVLNLISCYHHRQATEEA